MAFFSVSKANARIAELEKENSELKTQVSQMVADAAAMGDAAEKVSERFDQAQVDLATAKQTISTLQAQVAERDTKLAEAEGKAQKIGATRALEVLASVGHPALHASPTTDKAANKPQPELTGRDRFLASLKIV